MNVVFSIAYSVKKMVLSIFSIDYMNLKNKIIFIFFKYLIHLAKTFKKLFLILTVF